MSTRRGFGRAATADHLEEGFLGYFFRYEMNLALPLPELVTETGATYPNIRLENILETIKKLEDASKGKEEPSEIFKRLNGQGSRKISTAPGRRCRPARGASSAATAGPTYGGLGTVAPPRRP